MQALKLWSGRVKQFKTWTENYIKNIFFHVECHEGEDPATFMKFLCHGDLDVNMICPTDDTGDTLLHRAAACGNAPAVCLLLSMTDTDITIKNNKGLTASDIICTKINPHGDCGKFILKNKYHHIKYTVDKKECALPDPEYFNCQDPQFYLYTDIKDIFHDAQDFIQPSTKKHKKTES